MNNLTHCESVITDANNLYSGYLKAVNTSKWKPSTQHFMFDYLTELFSIQDNLRNRTLVNGPTQEFELHERGKIRPITSLTVRDRVIRHTLCDCVLMPEIRKHIIYDNCASLKDRGIGLQRKRFEIHLHKYYESYGNDGYILFGDFSKFYDNIIHEIAKEDLAGLVNHDPFVEWLLDIIFAGFEIDVSYMDDAEFECCMGAVFNKLAYREVPKELLTGERFMPKSVNMGDQISQAVGVYYPNRIDSYVKTVCGVKFYGRYCDDFYVMSPSKEYLEFLLKAITAIAEERGIHMNGKKTRIVKISSTYKYLQMKYSLTRDGRVIKRINPKRVTTMRRKLKKLAVKVEQGKMPYENVENMFKGWMGNYYKCLSRQQREGIVGLYGTLFHKKVHVKNKKLIIMSV